MAHESSKAEVYEAPVHLVWQEIAATAGASPLVQELARRAAAQAPSEPPVSAGPGLPVTPSLGLLAATIRAGLRR